ncbi:MAG: acyl-ACP desaturase [Frankiaceae bacterium]|nr:acyl-ACP desaturase [Frankiaceae bacterium]
MTDLERGLSAVDPTLQTRLLHELEPVVEENLVRHLSQFKEWMPHDYIPWSQGRDFPFLGGEDWSPEDSPLSEAARTSIMVNLLTEDNLPSYHREIATAFGRDGAWGEWVGRWTAEEARHSIALRDYLVVTRGVDPVKLENFRMAHMTAGYDSAQKSMLQAVSYVSFQELATRVSHRNTGKEANCPVADQLMARVALDENLHMIFYRNIIAAALDRAPNAAMQAIRDEVVNFHMPGSTMPDFPRNSVIIANAGIYDLQLHHDLVIQPVLKFWKIFDRDGFTGEGARARDELAAFIPTLQAQAARFVEHRERMAARRAARESAPPPRHAAD